MSYEDWQEQKRLTGYFPTGMEIDEKGLRNTQTALKCIVDYLGWLGFKNTSIMEYGPFGSVEYKLEHKDGRTLMVTHTRPLLGEIEGDIEIDVELHHFHVESEPFQRIGSYLRWARFEIC
jgi:hypothetical protein